MNKLKCLSTLFAAAALGAVANADIRDLNANVDGRGTLRFGNRNYDLTGASIKLNRDGSFDMTLRAGKDSHRVRGNWTRISSDRASLTANVGLTDKSRGVGWVSTKGRDELDEIRLSSTNNSFRADFRSTERNWENNRPPSGGVGGYWNGQFEDGVYGEGTYRRGGQVRRIREARVRLARSGKADVWLIMTDGFNLQLDGEWFDKRGDRIDLRIDEAGREGSADARGQVILDRRNQLHRIEIDGRIGRDNADIRFQRDDDFDGGWGGGNNNGFFDIDQSRNGSGFVEKRGDRWELNRASVRLTRNGTFDITLRSTKSYRYTGRYTRRGNVAELTISGGGIGSGRVTVSGNRFERVTFDVIDGSDRLRFDFDPR